MTAPQKASDLFKRYGYRIAIEICIEFSRYLMSYNTKPYLTLEQCQELREYWEETMQEIEVLNKQAKP